MQNLKNISIIPKEGFVKIEDYHFVNVFNRKKLFELLFENEIMLKLNLKTKMLLKQGKVLFSEVTEAYMRFFKAVDDCRKLTENKDTLSRTFVEYALLVHK